MSYQKIIIRGGIVTILISVALIGFSVGGYLAVRLGIQSIWLPLWLSVFELARPLTYLLLIIAVAVSCLMLRQRGNTIFATANILAALLLLIVVALVDGWFVRQGRAHLSELQSTHGISQSQAGYLPELPLKSIQGDQVKVQDLIRSKKVAILVFWASYNSPWSSNLSVVSDLSNKYNADGLIAVGINEQEQSEVVNKFINEKGIEFPILLDIDGHYLESLSLPGSSEKVIVVDSNGRLLDNLSKTQDVKERLGSIIRGRLKDHRNNG
jgi:peroxiredoxin